MSGRSQSRQRRQQEQHHFSFYSLQTTEFLELHFFSPQTMGDEDDYMQPVPDHAALLERRKRLIRETWCAVEQGLNVHATEAFYARLFERHKELEKMFAHADMRIQAMKLYEVLRVSVRFLDNMEQLTPMLQDMGVRHAEAYGVVREHYDAMNEVFITILNEYFSQHFPDKLSGAVYAMDVGHAWSWV